MKAHREAWATVRIGDLGEVFTGRTPPTERPDYFGGDYPFITPGDMRQGKYVRMTQRGVSQEGAQLLKRIKVPAESVCISCIGWQMGEVIMTDKPSFTNQQINTIVPNRNIDPSFLYYSLRPRKQELLSLGATTGVRTPILNKSAFSDLKVKLPPLPVQRRITGILSAYDELIENSQRRIRILESMARLLYREWFVYFRFPGHEKHPRVASPLGDIPQGWEVVSIDDVCERVTDGSHSSPKSVEEGLPMASSKDMHDWGLDLRTCRFISQEDYDQLVRNGCKPRKNDLLITKDGANYLKHIFVLREEQQLVILSSIAILRPNKRINPHLLTAILKSPENKARLKNYVTGAAIPRIILQDFKQFQILLPSQEAQRAWAKAAEPMTELCWRLIDLLRNLRRTRDLLLPRLLSGQVKLETN